MQHIFLKRPFIFTTLLLSMLLLPLHVQADFENDPPSPFFFDDSEVQEPLNPFSAKPTNTFQGKKDPDANKSAETLLQEGISLQMSDKLLEARTKFLKALQKDPNLLGAHLLLSEYYLRHVGHFKLALRYAKRAEQILYKIKGKPPYYNLLTKEFHKNILNLISAIRLNLDDYEGALAALDEFTKYNYTDEWVASSRAWILFKLGRNEEALKVARLGLFLGRSQRGAILNILGILLSTVDEKQASLQAFKEAYDYEAALGSNGDVISPLNNAGEVYREIFDERNARRNWERAVLSPKFCDHILLSINLATLNIEELNFRGARQNLLEFERCRAQFPLKNEEEHKSLMNMALGRIALHTGDIDEALKTLEIAAKERQFFGKIGTNQSDMQAAALSSLAQALLAKNNHLKFYLPSGAKERLQISYQRASNRIRSWWLMRRARQILMEDLNDFEDIYIRNTDSMLEYPLLGSVLADIPTRLLKNRLKRVKELDKRPTAEVYYKTFLAENLIQHGAEQEAHTILNEVLSSIREPFDNALKVKILVLKLSLLQVDSKDYQKLAYKLFSISRSELINYGLRFPVQVNTNSEELLKNLNASIFLRSTEARCLLNHIQMADQQHSLVFSCQNLSIPTRTVLNSDLRTAINDLTLSVFKREL
ncbi:MAG: tetratricopeptide repeat protein [Bdellovibrionota bacterium]|jgi:tetratricopeptide (TPR) repeat protein